MQVENLEQLKKIAKVFNTDNIVTPEQIQEVLQAIVGILSHFQGQTKKMNEETKLLLNKVLHSVDTENRKIRQDIDKKNATSSEDFAKTIAQVKALIPNVKNGDNGKDADPEAMMLELLARIKLPEYKEAVLDTPAIIANKLEELEGDDRLDVSAIKGLEDLIRKFIPKFTGFKNTVGGGVQSVTSEDGSVTIRSTGAKGKGVVDLSVNGSGGGGARYEIPDGDIDGVNTEFVVENVPVAVVLNGATYFEDDGYTFDEPTMTITMLVTPVVSSTLRSSY